MLEKKNPSTGQCLAHYPMAGEEEARRAFTAAQKASSIWKQSSLKARSALLKCIAKRVHQQADQLALLISDETGKPLCDALEADIGTTLGILNYYAEIGPSSLRSQWIFPDLISLITGRLHQEVRHPRGVIGIISPWNYPLAIPASGIAAALMAGNTIILKPSELAPGTGKMLIDIVRHALAESHWPEDIAQVLIGDGLTGACMIETRLDGVIFTGSQSVGQKIRKRFIDKEEKDPSYAPWISMELGGSDAMIVLDGCDLEKVASYALWGRYTNAGQACAAVKRLFVPEHQAETLITHLKNKIAALRVGPPDTPTNHIGPLISEAQLQQVEAQVQDALNKGATLLAGGHRLNQPGWFYAPTLLSNAPISARILTEEVFGPALPIITYKSVEDALEQANNSPFGLTACVFGPEAQARKMADQLECATVVINDVGPSNYAMACAPWGGWKGSGAGVSHGGHALQELTRSQIVSTNMLYHMPLLNKPLWHFGRSAAALANRSNAVMAFSNRSSAIFNPKTWLAFWQNRSSTKI